MAVYSRHPASAPPVAPERERMRHILLRAWFTFVLVYAFTLPGWVLAFGSVITTLVGGVVVVLSGALVASIRPPFQWRRLPWIAGGFILWAGVSVMWSLWPLTSVLTWFILVATTIVGIALASVLTWREIVRAIGAALAWVIGISIVFEVLVAWIVGGPLYAGFATTGGEGAVVWTTGELFSGGRMDGIMGDPNLFGVIALMAVIVFSLEFAAGEARRAMLGVWIAVSVLCLGLAASVTAWVAALGVVLVLATVLLMRTARRPGERTRYYVGYAIIGVGGGLLLWLNRDAVFLALDRATDLIDRETVWAAVLAQVTNPALGSGFATPWTVGDPSFTAGIMLDGAQATSAHSVWVDVFFQLGVVGVILLACVYLAFVWRSWFFAVDRPRWDLRADRPYSPLTLLPTLTGAVLLVQGVAESAPLMGWGWMLLIVLGSKIKQSPHIGEGAAEQRVAIELGEPLPAR
ncbi:hypothetical protein GCM10009808_02750 [Microbacterium sediminicola]|uniref:O-antigen ligase n=1 Tax=Microbacterium sediminicola TaxID=415210 RepID=A0ABN2HLF2_9MICO